MKHVSVPVDNSVEFIWDKQISPLISHCQIKVCYVGNDPNRNGTVISRAVATEMGKKLPGSPIVGYFNQENGDFEEHNRDIEIKDGKFAIVDVTRPYGFVDVNADVWFQKFVDDGVEHEYLMTEGWIWTDAYPEAQRIVEQGNNQSMELNSNSVQGNWAEGLNGQGRFFIINEAIIEKLCILGDDFEPCFEGAQIRTEFSLENELAELRTAMFSMMNELKELQEGGSQPMNEETKILENSLEEEVTVEETVEEVEVEVEEVAAEEVEIETAEETPAEEFKNEEDKEEEPEDKEEEEYALEEEEVAEEATVSQEQYAALEAENAELKATNASLTEELTSLREFKLASERKDKEAMINSFYMLSDEDKADVRANIDSYSLEDIEAKLAVICVRNKVNFNLEEEDTNAEMTFSLDSANQNQDAGTPAWIKAVKETASNM